MNMKETRPDDIVLCLSGGGLRATFFHLGAIIALKDAGLLGSVREVYSVSGGSITAAHLALNWNKYNGTRNEMENIALELIKIGDRDIRGRVLRRHIVRLMMTPPILKFLHRLGIPKFWLRVGVLTNEYRRLFQKFELRRLKELNAPRIHILATSLITGKLAVFTSEGLSIGGERFGGEEIQIAVAVAASSAFPPLFPPVEISREEVGARRDRFHSDKELLSDGGIFDNLGYFLLQSENPNRHIIVMDASADFDFEYNKDYASLFSRTIRYTDIIMKRLSDETLEKLRMRPHFSHIKIGQLAYDASTDNRISFNLAPETHAATATIRTDLDIFSKAEIKALLINGYMNCSRDINFNVKNENISYFDFIIKGLVKNKHLKNSNNTRYFFLNRNDIVSYVFLALSAVYLFFVLPLSYIVVSAFWEVFFKK